VTDPLTLVALALAVWRVCRMWVAEDGPFDIFARARHRLGVHEQKTWVQRGLACTACLSFWVSLAVSWPVSSSVWAWLLQAMAISAVSVILMRKVG
jgi:hypothetical protein